MLDALWDFVWAGEMKVDTFLHRAPIGAAGHLERANRRGREDLARNAAVQQAGRDRPTAGADACRAEAGPDPAVRPAMTDGDLVDEPPLPA